MAKCNCDLCKRGRKFDRIIKDIMKPWNENTFYPDERRRMNRNIKWLKDLYSHLIDVEAELDWYKNEDLIKSCFEK